MSAVLVVLGGACIVLVALPALVLFVEVVAGWKPVAVRRAAAVRPPPYVVLMPAHDEAGTIATTIAAVLEQLPSSARLLVVADNCGDRTAAKALRAGAEVIERHSPLLRGKGYALAFGIEHLRRAPPQVVVILDADCTPGPRALDLLAARASESGGPVQGLDLMLAHGDSPLSVRMAAFAWAMKNEVRPRGLERLGLPCQLMGTGMAFPWACIAAVDFASGHLAEDLQLGTKLAEAGHAPRFCPEALVQSWFPEGRVALGTQRRRWEHGHLSMILSGAPGLLLRAARARNLGALALAVDLCVPPLALLASMVLATCTIGGWLAWTGAASPLLPALSALSALAFAAAVLLAWWSVGRRWVLLPELASAPVYVLRKLPVYAGFLLRRQREWVRTGRQRGRARH